MDRGVRIRVVVLIPYAGEEEDLCRAVRRLPEFGLRPQPENNYLAHESPRLSAQRDVVASGRATVNTPSIPLR